MSEPVVFEHLPKRKLDGLLAEGYEINGYCFQKVYPDGSVKRGAITTGGMVLWWNDPHPPVSIKPEANDDPCPGCRPGTVCRTPACGRLAKNRVEAQLGREVVWTEDKKKRLKQALEQQVFFPNRQRSLVTGDGHDALTFHSLQKKQ